jgi:hypothetical protein
MKMRYSHKRVYENEAAPAERRQGVHQVAAWHGGRAPGGLALEPPPDPTNLTPQTQLEATYKL